MIFNINFNKLIKWLLPHFLNKTKQIAWLSALLYPIVWLHAQYLIYRDQKLSDATINSQVIRLTKALRDKFSNLGIYILHFSDYLDQAFIYLRIEGATIEYDYIQLDNHSPADYDFLSAEYDNQYDFIVRIPVGMALKADQVNAFVQLYKFSSKRFKIETF